MSLPFTNMIHMQAPDPWHDTEAPVWNWPSFNAVGFGRSLLPGDKDGNAAGPGPAASLI